MQWPVLAVVLTMLAGPIVFIRGLYETALKTQNEMWTARLAEVTKHYEARLKDIEEDRDRWRQRDESQRRLTDSAIALIERAARVRSGDG